VRSLLPHSSNLRLFLSLVFLGGCGGGDGIILPGDGEPAEVAVLRGDKQRGRVGEPLSDPLVVEVTDTRGRTVPGATVVFELTSAGSRVIPPQKSTDANGRADARVVLGTSVGSQTGKVRVATPEGKPPVQADFTAMALSEDAISMAAVAGMDQTGHVGQPLDDRLVVEVTDGFGNPVAGAEITWSAEGGGTVSASVVATDEDGRSRVERTLGPAVGQQTTVASSGVLAGSPVTFVHTALAGDASRLVIVSGNDQTAEAGTALPEDPVVRLVDSEGNGVPGTAVTWLAAIGGGSVAPENSTTDGDGRTSARWTLGQALGGQRLDAVVSGVGVASFHATATASAPASIFIRTQPSATARNGVPLGRQPMVQLKDASGNDAAVAGVEVTVELGGGGELGGTSRRSTDAAGRAEFNDLSISGAPGRRTLVFRATGYAQTTSDEIDLQAIGTSTTITADSPDPSGAGSTFPVQVRVASDGPTPTGSVTITVSGGTPSCTATLTGGVGSCELTLNGLGDRTLTATYPGGPGFSGSSDTEPHRVDPPPPENEEPFADFNWHCEGLTCHFTDNSRDDDGNQTITSRHWDFGDGATADNVLNPSHTYRTPGEYTVVLRVTDNGGLTDESSDEVDPEAPPPPNQPPTAEFTWQCNELDCEFEDQSTDGDGEIDDRAWEFGDGETSNNRNPDHEYDAGGTYTIKLTVTDNDGASASVEHAVTVTGPPPPPANTTTTITGDNPEPSDPGVPITVSFSVTSSSGTPDGTVQVTEANGGNCSGSVASGNCTLTPVGTGERTITATYQGSSSFNGSSGRDQHTVNSPPASTTTTITGDTPNSSEQGVPFSVGFEVSSPSGTPSGSVTVSDGTDSCSGILGTDGKGNCGLTLHTMGTRSLTATYAGNSSFSPSTSLPVDHEVVAAPTPPPSD
jgi:PKD repeat protein